MQFSMNPDPASWLELSCETGVTPLEHDQYPDGSFSFRLAQPCPIAANLYLTLKSTLPQALMAAGQIINAIRRDHLYHRVSLVIQTLPDQRADRVTRENASVPSQVTANIIDALRADEVVVHDVHSLAALNYLRSAVGNVRHVDSLACFVRAGLTVKPGSYVVAVDKGAVARAEAFAGAYNAQVIYMDKTRDAEGRITGHAITNLEHLNYVGGEVWIVDDLCDGGFTFISVGQLLAKQGWNIDAYRLFVTHGLFSKGRDELLANFDSVDCLFAYDEWRTIDPALVEASKAHDPGLHATIPTVGVSVKV